MKKLIMLWLAMLPLMGFAQEQSKELEEMLNNTINEINTKFSPQYIRPKINKDQSKVEAIKGTWTISYKDDTQHTDKLVIDDIFILNNGDITAKGKWYFDQKGDGQLAFCTYFSGDELRIINSDYLCMTVGGYLIGDIGSYKGFAFSYSGNTILSGTYGSGFSPEIIATNLVLYGKPLTGYRGDPPPPDAYQSTYNLIQWNKRGNDNDYCLDIFDDKGIVYPNLHPVQCGANMANFSPIGYVKNVLNYDLPSGFAFRWKIWSRVAAVQGQTIGNQNYGGTGYEGRVVVP